MAAYAKPAQLNPSRIANVYETCDPITPADNTAIGPYMGFFAGVAGNVVICTRNGDASSKRTVPVVAGVVYPIAIQGVDATGTTATGIFGVA